MKTAQIKVVNQSVTVKCHVIVEDLNRLRWLKYSLKNNKNFISYISNAPSTENIRHIFDSRSLSNIDDIALGSFVILWDGYNSYIELINSIHSTKDRLDLIFVIVGNLNDLDRYYFHKHLPLFSSVFDVEDGAGVSVISSPLQKTLQNARTLLRYSKNSIFDCQRHRQLAKFKSMVFCGLVRPSPNVFSDLLRGVDDTKLMDILLLLSKLDLCQYRTVESVCKSTINYLCSGKKLQSNYLAIYYSLINIVHRICVISKLRCNSNDVFISEFGFDPHIDPYDSFGYKQNLYLDFGSTRGPDLIYPRVIDLILRDKHFIQLRLIEEKENFQDFLSRFDDDRFLSTCDEHVNQILVQYRQLCGSVINEE